MSRSPADYPYESREPEAWLQGAIARLFGERREARPRGVPLEVEDAWSLGNLHAPAIDLETGSLIEVHFPIDFWGNPEDGEVFVRRIRFGTPEEVVRCTSRAEAADLACTRALQLGVSSVRIREQEPDDAPVGRVIDYVLTLEDVHAAVCRLDATWQSTAGLLWWERGIQD